MSKVISLDAFRRAINRPKAFVCFAVPPHEPEREMTVQEILALEKIAGWEFVPNDDD